MNQSHIVEEPGNGGLKVFPLPTDTESLKRLLTDVFENYWDSIFFGSAVQGAGFKIRAPNAPVQIRFLDGYLTVDFGQWHFNICIGDHRGTARNAAPPHSSGRALPAPARGRSTWQLGLASFQREW